MLFLCISYLQFPFCEGKSLEGRVKLQAQACEGTDCCHVVMFKLDSASPLIAGFEGAD